MPDATPEREPLLEQLRAGLAAARGGKGRLVLVTGEAGIGKTAVINALCVAAAPWRDDVAGACDPVVPARPFAPIADMAVQIGGGLRAALLRADREAMFDRFLAVLRELPSGSVIIIEDLHCGSSADASLKRVSWSWGPTEGTRSTPTIPSGWRLATFPRAR